MGNRTKLILGLMLVFIAIWIAKGAELSREVPASDVLAKIEAGQPAWFDNCTIVGDLNFSVLEIDGQVHFNNTRFQSPHYWSPANFSGTIFKRTAYFGGATFSGDALFNGATFSGDALFNGATFNEHARFNRVTFSEDTLFDGATFNEYAEFDGATFSGNAWFNGATFNETACFNGATFETLNGYARFGGTTFNETAWFRGAIFSGDVLFDGVTFSGNANFGGATFSGSAWFERVTFGGDAWFDRVTFSGYFFGWYNIKNALICSTVTYLELINNFKDHGQFDEADDCYYTSRYRSRNSIFDLVGWITCGFGVRPMYAVYSSLVLILLFGFVYWIGNGIYNLSAPLQERTSDKGRTWSLSAMWNSLFLEMKKLVNYLKFMLKKILIFLRTLKLENISKMAGKLWYKSFTTNITLKDALYFSALVFFTLHPPHDWEYSKRWRYVVLFEDILGGVFITLFIVTLGNVMIRY